MVLQRALLWIAAIAVAAWVLQRVVRGRDTIVRGPWAARVVRVVALVIVLVAPDGRRAVAQPQPRPAPAAADLLPRSLRADLSGRSNYARVSRSNGPWKALGRELASVDARGHVDATALARAGALVRSLGSQPSARELSQRLSAHLERRASGAPATIRELEELLDTAEAVPVYDGWLVAYLYRRSAEARGSAHDRAALYGRLHRHMRIAAALVRAWRVEVRYVPWTKKSAPPVGYVSVVIPRDLPQEVERLLPQTDAGHWDRDAGLDVFVEGAATLLRGGIARPIARVPLRLLRLDVLVTGDAPVVLRSGLLGDIAIPPRVAIDAHSLPDRLPDPARARIERWIQAALRRDTASLDALAATLPASHRAIRAAIEAQPSAHGVGSLRILAALFEE